MSVVVLFIIVFIGTFGNSIVILIILLHRDMRTVTNYFVLNLAITDIAMLIICDMPTGIVLAKNTPSWPLGDLMCRLIGYTMNVTVQATCLTLTAMTIDRYFLIVHAVRSRNTRTTRRAALFNIGIWLFSVVVHVPVLVFNKTEESENGNLECDRNFGWNHGNLIYYLFIVLAMYVVPLSIIMFCYIQILYQVWHKTSAGTESAQANARSLRRKKKITRMVFIVVFLFALCWAPMHTINLWLYSDSDHYNNHVKSEVYTLCLGLAYANSCVNPFVYAFTTTSFKKYFKKFFWPCWRGKARENISVSISMKTKSERLTASQGKEDSSI
ncbi:G-protein coupled receptor 54-like [Diadema setosum]|uniref:G-protein coupled receptor 54-like n=1 Tax=Diadema setosum TaxID=31175 RepID=UPI003B3A2CC8